MSFIYNDYRGPWDEKPDPNQREPWDERPDENERPTWDENMPNNPLLALLGIQQNDNGNIARTQQKKVKNQYPALSNIFGTKAQSGFMSLDGDDGGGDDEPVYPDDDGTIHGGVEYPGGDDPEPVDYPDWYPEPQDTDEPSRRNNKPYNHPTLFGSILNTVLSQTLGITFNSAQQAAYYRGNDQTHSPDYKDSVQQLKISINALNETHKIQQTNLDKMLNKVTDAKNQDDYTQNLRAYSQLREQAQSTQNLATRIQYAADNHDYQNVALEVQNYTIPEPPSTTPAPTLSDLDQNDWRYEHNTQLQAGLEKSFGISSNTQPQYYFNQQANYNTAPVQNYYPEPQAPEHNFGTSDFPVFHLGVANDNATVPEEINIPPETGQVLSGGITLKDFIKSVGEDAPKGEKVLQQVLVTYNSPVGLKIEATYQAELQAGVQKILNECVDSMKAMKVAGEIAEKTSKYLAWAYIFEQAAEGYYSGGSIEAKKKFINAGFEVIRTFILESILTIGLGIEALPAFAIILVLEFILNKLELIKKD